MKRLLPLALLFGGLLTSGCDGDSQQQAARSVESSGQANAARDDAPALPADAPAEPEAQAEIAWNPPRVPNPPDRAELNFSPYGSSSSPGSRFSPAESAPSPAEAPPPISALPNLDSRDVYPPVMAEVAPEPTPPPAADIPRASTEAFPSNPLRSMQMARSAPRAARSYSAEPPAGGSARPSFDAVPRFAPEAVPESASLEPERAPLAAIAPSPPAPPPTASMQAVPMQAAPVETPRMQAAPMQAASELPMLEAPAGENPQSSTTTTPPAEAFDVVRVFYGTDRAALEPLSENWSQRGSRFLATGIALLATLICMAAAASIASFRWSLAAVAVCGCIATTGFGYHATTTTIYLARQTAKEGLRYGTGRSEGGQLQVGICEVTIPKTHQKGELESPSILRLEVSEDARKHVVLRKTEPLEDELFYTQLRQRVAQSPRKELFVFIHGFNTSFEDAARRTAQMAHDLPFEGAPIFYSWPANELYLLTYPVDETNVAWTVPHLKRFLLAVVEHSDARSINLIAHSMGNRALTTTLRELELEFKGDARMFNQVVLAAPDIDAADFRDNIAPAIRQTAQRVTLYASSGDQALAASQLVHRYPRAGDTHPQLVLAEGLDTIDVSLVGSSPWGHSYYGSSDPVLRDLALLLRDSLPPAQRRWLSSADAGGQLYWVFQATIGQTDSTARQPAVGPPLNVPR